MDDLKLALVLLLRFLLRALRVLPVRRGRVAFVAFNGARFACNPKYISEYLEAAHPGALELVWLLDAPERHAFLRARGLRTVRFRSLAGLAVLATARVVVTNTGLPAYLSFRRGQVLVNTWHGGGAYKKCGYDLPIGRAEARKLALTSRDTALFLSSSRRFSEVMAHSIRLPAGRMWEIGMPRNDLLLADRPDLRAAVRARYGLAPDVRILLHAPTFRGGASSAVDTPDALDYPACLAALAARFGGTWAALRRAHQAVRPDAGAHAGALDASDHPDMQELLSAADVLVTDYSSAMWDMSLTGRPCFIYAPDLDGYRRERDFYTPVDEWPFPVATSLPELRERIASFDEGTYAQAVRAHHAALGSCETGHAARDAGERIRALCLDGGPARTEEGRA